MTVDLFDSFFLDNGTQGGYFSHLDPITLRPTQPSRSAPNRGKKNWNSVGDHAPGLPDQPLAGHRRGRATPRCSNTPSTPSRRTSPTTRLSPFVQEKFHEDWSPGPARTCWQQNRAVVGHNLKIAWNLMRMYGLQAEGQVRGAGRARSARSMPAVGSDQQRGGWYDVVERSKLPGRGRSTASPSTTARRGGSRSRASWPT